MPTLRNIREKDPASKKTATNLNGKHEIWSPLQIKSYKLDFINLFIMSKLMGKKRDRYRKMPLKTKIMFLKRVFEEGHSIKKVSAEYKINYSTAKTLIRNEKLKKGKFKLSEISFESTSFDREPLEVAEETGLVAGYRVIDFKPRDQNQALDFQIFSKIEVISRIQFPSCNKL